jgi:hypothetical protein
MDHHNHRVRAVGSRCVNVQAEQVGIDAGLLQVGDILVHLFGELVCGSTGWVPSRRRLGYGSGCGSLAGVGLERQGQRGYLTGRKSEHADNGQDYHISQPGRHTVGLRYFDI